MRLTDTHTSVQPGEIAAHTTITTSIDTEQPYFPIATEKVTHNDVVELTHYLETDTLIHGLGSLCKKNHSVVKDRKTILPIYDIITKTDIDTSFGTKLQRLYETRNTVSYDALLAKVKKFNENLDTTAPAIGLINIQQTTSKDRQTGNNTDTVKRKLIVDDAALQTSPTINAELLNTLMPDGSINSDISWQKRKNEFENAFGEKPIQGFKSQAQKDALGYVTPAEILATGGKRDTTPLTKYRHLGEKRVGEMHPSGKLLAVTDFNDLSRTEITQLRSPYKKDIFDSPTLQHVIADVIKDPPRTESGLVRLLTVLADFTLSDTLPQNIPLTMQNNTFLSKDPRNIVGIAVTKQLEKEMEADQPHPVSFAPVTDVANDATENKNDDQSSNNGIDKTTLTNAEGDTFTLQTKYWNLVDRVADVVPEPPAFGSNQRNIVRLQITNALSLIVCGLNSPNDDSDK